MILLPFIISGLTGYLLVGLLTRKSEPQNFLLKLILGIGLGLGLSSHLTFYSFLFLDKLEPKIIIVVHVVLLIVLCSGACRFGTLPLSQLKSGFAGRGLPSVPPAQSIGILIFSLIIFLLVIQQARFYPYGGWDAWQVWNFKAKFLLLSGDNWHNLFLPDLWRSSPHYPLLLPLINVWAWLFTGNPVDIGPMITSVLFTFLTASLVSATLWQKTKNYLSFAPAFLLLSLPFFNLMATTQYCDIVLAFYLLAAIITADNNKLLCGIFAGFLAFTKPEGMVAALLICVLVAISTFRNFKDLRKFILGLVLTSLPVLAFQFWLSPGNQTFINGLTSTAKPSDMGRLQMIFGFFFVELLSQKWNGLWIFVLVGIILGGKNIWTKNKITAGFLLLYLAVIILYYQINTYFEIKWWLSVSLNRILFSLLPLFFFWVFSGVLSRKD